MNTSLWSWVTFRLWAVLRGIFFPHYFHILHIIHKWKVKVLVTESCPTLYNSMDYSPPGSSVHGSLQARILEWVAISLSRGSSWPRDQTWVSCIAGRFFTFWATRKADCPQNTTRKTVQLPNHLLFWILRSSVIELQMFVQKQCGILKICVWRTAVTVQWLKLCLPRQSVWVWSLVGELRSHVPHSQKTKT